MGDTIAVLMGGFSREREVSLRSGAAVARGLRQAGYKVVEVDVTGPELALPEDLQAVFIALHGEYGEDGAVQERLEALGVAYTGSGPTASRLAFDKILSKQVLLANGLPTPDYEVLRPGGRRNMRLPAVVKPPRQGSSFGVHRVLRESDWPAALAEAMIYNGEVMVEEFVPGRELTVGIVGGQALPVIEIRAPRQQLRLPRQVYPGRDGIPGAAPLPDSIARRCRSLAMQTFQALGGRGFGRVDFRMREDGALFVLELNTIPGFTETSLLPKAAAAAGMPFADLCRQITELALAGALAPVG